MVSSLLFLLSMERTPVITLSAPERHRTIFPSRHLLKSKPSSICNLSSSVLGEEAHSQVLGIMKWKALGLWYILHVTNTEKIVKLLEFHVTKPSEGGLRFYLSW